MDLCRDTLLAFHDKKIELMYLGTSPYKYFDKELVIMTRNRLHPIRVIFLHPMEIGCGCRIAPIHLLYVAVYAERKRFWHVMNAISNTAELEKGISLEFITEEIKCSNSKLISFWRLNAVTRAFSSLTSILIKNWSTS